LVVLVEGIPVAFFQNPDKLKENPRKRKCKVPGEHAEEDYTIPNLVKICPWGLGNG